MSDYEIAVDTKKLAEALGLPAWPDWPAYAGSGPAYLVASHQRMAARVITDARQPDSITGKVSADIAIHNATVWIDLAFDQGMREGIQLERRAWNAKIRSMFGLL
jgi:hypothetical protein